MLEKLFKLTEKKTTVRTEIIAGVTTFLAMAYILAVNPAILGDAGMDAQSVFLATAIASALGSVLMGLFANYPVALAPGMGVNAFFTYSAVMLMGETWQSALAAVFVSGVLFLLISVTGVRKVIINAIPKQLKIAIAAGIGFFIAFVGLKNAGIIVASEATGVAMGALTEPTVLLAIFGIIVTFALVARNVPAAVFLGLVITAVVGLVFGLMGVEGMPQLPETFELNFKMTTIGGFAEGFSQLFSNIPNMIVIVFSFLFVDFFDTAGTLVGIGNRIGLVNDEGEMEGVEKALLADAIASVVGSMIGTSTVTSFVESTSGVAVGGRTGLTAVTTGVLFLVSILFAPIVLSVVTSAVTTPALVVVGVMMSQQLKEIDWDDFAFAASGFVTVIMMILTYSIANGIAWGFIIYTIVMLATKRSNKISPVVVALDIVFILYFSMDVWMKWF
ncbi:MULTISPECIES: NCS2 family permease [unclassified Breznakia]|uniref:NCS2 family permease n=1 Tax=unclassified Breznakia TaxID=2623764 RepID=UPI0024739F2F|nr:MULTISPECIES: NCS2 family permease [unclassified Breznakia]MDH6365912.1 AGZA family xanthine/uracil permease-like MFS transporter [Breznakia sp. PH1-1]MDH6403156.1 AGZA family xanthine/uracil permease-like MFS transporter [Breznakia sp. PF1-11]MDH6410865.1 AGZA family xanthine/uracil permease-like MFS transporter [Breznakia sp. PFB1-11]MDH6413078.1 AGZA family xanthine/uracil permease-like MFS transporter [Breznakia sp. PFB1-14]MDH6415446.1 AGZA family xanthine/uracil permease-like MFS tran